MPRAVLIIANPIAGAGRGPRLAKGLEAALGRQGLRAEVCFTTAQRSGAAIARELAPDAWHAIAVIGGDGSLADVVRGLRSSGPPIAVLPAGTANVWAREAGIPHRPDAVAEMIARGRTIDAPLGSANDVPFVLFAGAGIDGRLVARVEAARQARRSPGGMRRWILPGLLELRRPLADLAVEAEGRRLAGMAQVLVTRVRCYAGWLRLPTGIDIADGDLHVLAFPRRPKAALVLTGLRAAVAGLRPSRAVIHIATRGRVRIDSSGAAEPFHRDGDHAGHTPLEVELADRRVRLLVP